MALDFPDSPSDNEYYEGFVYNSTAGVWQVRRLLDRPAAVSGTTGSPTVTTDGDATIYTFTGDGTITFGSGGIIDVLLVGGGGGSKGYSRPSGGGGGQARDLSGFYVNASSYTITVGAGGSAGGNAAGFAGFGSNSYFGAELYVGSGMGGFSIEQRNWQNAGYGYEGNPGGLYSSNTTGVGGCFGAGAGDTGSVTGFDSDITGSTVTYGTGGDDNNGVAGSANTGDGAGGVNGASGAAGGSGVVIVRVG